MKRISLILVMLLMSSSLFAQSYAYYRDNPCTPYTSCVLVDEIGVNYVRDPRYLYTAYPRFYGPFRNPYFRNPNLPPSVYSTYNTSNPYKDYGIGVIVVRDNYDMPVDNDER